MHPRQDQDNLGTIACWHGRYDFNDPGVYTSSRGAALLTFGNNTRYLGGTWQDIERGLVKEFDAKLVLPIYLYDHSIQALSTESFVGRAHHAQWDSGRVGFIFVTAEKLRHEYGVKRITKRVLDTATAVLKAEVEEYSNYLIYGEDYDAECEEE